MKVRKREIRPLLFARITPVETQLKPDRLKHKLDALDIFCIEQGYTPLGRYGSVALQDATYPELEDAIKQVKDMKPKPNALIIKDWDDFPDHMIDSVQLMMKCKNVGLSVFTVSQLLGKGDDVENGFDEEEGDEDRKQTAAQSTFPKYRIGQTIDTMKGTIKILEVYPPGQEYATSTMYGYRVNTSDMGFAKLLEATIDRMFLNK